ncbi:Hypothetical protein PHPALM_13386 [Phytophthora palmivora]|uniref:Uncharacterized protein n=1 Tax=Phytophthora palmivora TaxID=4796 RepID=A0A2P4XXA8_9STRA|nr:Hypothetical protein PHPALM_13386 [Phytophthora palmivora]
MLTVGDPEKVAVKGINWVKREIRWRCKEEGHYQVEEWNVHGLEKDIVARPNNPQEHFHGEQNNSLNPHTNIITLVLIIRSISQSYVTKLANVAVGRRGRGTKTNAKISKYGRNKKDYDQTGYNLPQPIDLDNIEALSDDDSDADRLLVWTFVNPQIKTPL